MPWDCAANCMLAERKPRKKVSRVGSVQNKEWFKEENGSNGFGAKMLHKMGWSEGKGLGRNEQGDSEYIRVKHKVDKIGVGFDPAQDSKLSLHMDRFNSILSNLTVIKNDHGNDSETKSISVQKAEDTDWTNRNVTPPESFHNIDQVRRHKMCKRRLQNKTLHNKRRKDLDIVLGVVDRISEKPSFELNSEVTTSEGNGYNTVDCTDFHSLIEHKSEMLDSTEGPVAKKRKKQKIKHMEESKNVAEESVDGTDFKIVTSTMSVQQYFQQKMSKKLKTLQTPTDQAE